MDFLSLRLSNVGLSATSSVQNKVIERLNSGKKIIGLSVGEPDFDTPKNIKTAAIKAINEGKTKYTASDGNQRLKEAVIKNFQLENDLCYSTNEVIISSGGKQVIFNALLATINEGDEVAIIAQYWVSYPDITKISGGIPKIIQTKFENGFKVTKEDLEKNLSCKTKWLIINSPSNPTGAVYSKEELLKLSSVLKKFTNVNVLSDEIYEHLVYGSNIHYSLPSLVPECADQTVILNGVAKTYAMTGWRVGWIVAPEDVAKASSTLQSHQTSNVANISQQAALAAVSGTLDAVGEMRTAFDTRRQVMYSMLSEIDGVSVLEPQGAFYAFPNFSGCLNREIAGKQIETTLDLAELFLEEIHVAVVPGEAFGAPGYARLSFALGDDDLKEGLGRIADLLNG